MQIVKVLADRSTNRIPLGKQGENEATAIEFCCKTWLEMWPNAIVALAVQPPQGEAYPAVVERDGNIARWVITAADTAYPGTGKCELRVLDGEVVKKSITFMTFVAESFTATGEAPDPVEDWIEDAQATLGEVDDALTAIPQAIDTALQEAKESGEFDGPPGAPGADGEDGADGVSPTVIVTDITGGHRVTITDADGTHVFDVLNGTDGQDGSPGTDGVDGQSAYVWIRYSATQPTQDSDMKTTPDAWMGIYSGDSATAPTAYTAYTWYNIKGQTGPVSDVQINGTSVVTNGVANVPLMSASTYGVAKLGNANVNYGIAIYNGELYVSNPTDTQIKNGNSGYRPIQAGKQHMATFYGLAKIAGSDEKNSTLPAGQYTDAAKSAISTMLNAPVSVSGSTPTITALPGIQYVCGEVSTLDITLPASGCVDVVFESGSTPTVLTITPPTGVTIKWANGFDPTALEANTTYEINIKDGLGVAGQWT